MLTSILFARVVRHTPIVTSTQRLLSALLPASSLTVASFSSSTSASPLCALPVTSFPRSIGLLTGSLEDSALLSQARSLWTGARGCDSTDAVPINRGLRASALTMRRQKGKKGGKGRSSGRASASKDEDDEAQNEDDDGGEEEESGPSTPEETCEKAIKKTETAMQRTVDHFARDLSRVQMGVAHPAMLDHLVVRAYGESDVPLPSLAQASVRDSLTLLLRVYDPEVLTDIENVLETSGMDLSVRSTGREIIVNLPKVTKEHRQQVIKDLRRIAEQARVSVRHARQTGMKKVKAQAKKLSKDDAHNFEQKLDTVAKASIASIDKFLDEKVHSIENA